MPYSHAYTYLVSYLLIFLLHIFTHVTKLRSCAIQRGRSSRRRKMMCLSVRSSVCPSRSGITTKRLNRSSRCYCSWVEPSVVVYCDVVELVIRSMNTGRRVVGASARSFNAFDILCESCLACCCRITAYRAISLYGFAEITCCLWQQNSKYINQLNNRIIIRLCPDNKKVRLSLSTRASVESSGLSMNIEAFYV